MDYLDGNLHQSILGALAANLASTSDHDDVALLTEQFINVLEPVTNGSVNGILDRLTPNAAGGANSTASRVTSSQVESAIAFAQYAAGSQEGGVTELQRILELIRAVPTWDWEPALGIQASQEWALSDQLTCALVQAALSLINKGVGDRAATVQAVVNLQHNLIEEMERSEEGYRIIGYLLPALNGVRRALASSTFIWTASDNVPVPSNRPSPSALTTVRETVEHDWDLTTDGGRLALATIAQYESQLSSAFTSQSRALSAGLLVLSDLEAQDAYWKSVLSHSGHSGARDTPAYGSAKKLALETWARTIRELEQADSETTIDSNAFHILRASLSLATTASLDYTSFDDNDLITILEGLLSHPATVSDESLQITAVECMQILIQRFPSLWSKGTTILRRYILSPSPVFEQTSDLSPSVALVAAASAYAARIDMSGREAMRESIIQSLFNHFSVVHRDGLSRSYKRESDARSIRSVAGTLSDPQKGAVSANVAHAVAHLAISFQDVRLAGLVSSMLLQRLTGSDPLVDGAVMYSLTTLIPLIGKEAFVDIVKAFNDVTKSLSSDSDMTSVVLTAQTHLATAVARRPDFHLEYLSEILSLFVHTGTHQPDRDFSKNARAESLLELIPVIDRFLAESKFDHRRDLSPGLIGQFRDMWYLCLLSGFLSTPVRVADWQRNALIRIASHTPTLLRGVGHDFIETELEYNGILKSTSHALTHDTIRGEFAAAVPQQATNARSLPVQQILFAATVLRLESLRAEAGQPGSMLSYFHMEGINNHQQLYETLSSVADKVNSNFVAHLSGMVTTHTMDKGVYHQMRDIVVECGHQYSKARTVALRYLNDLFSSFPSLLCHDVVVTALLEMLTLMRRACLSEFTDEYTPTYTFHSARGGFSITLADDYALRNKILSDFHRYARAWLKAAITRAPLEVRNLLQNYIDEPVDARHSVENNPDDEMGKSVAIDIVRLTPANANSSALPNWGDWRADESSTFARSFAAKKFFGGQASQTADRDREQILEDLEDLAEQLEKHKVKVKIANLRQLFYRAGGHLVHAKEPDVEILDYVVSLPVRIFTEGSTALAQEIWTWIVDARPELEARLMIELVQAWTATIANKQGLFSTEAQRGNPLNEATQFTPTDKEAMMKDYRRTTRLLQPHLTLLGFLASRFQAFRYHSASLVLSSLLLVMRTAASAKTWSTHPLARELRMRLVSFGFCVLQGSQLESALEYNLRATLFDAALDWFAAPPTWSYGSNRIQLKADLQAVEELASAVKSDSPSYGSVFTSLPSRNGSLPGRIHASSAAAQQKHRVQLLSALLDNEADRLKLWINPMMDSKHGPLPSRAAVSDSTWKQLARIAWSHWPDVAIQLPARIKHAALTAEVTRLVQAHPARVQHNPDALAYFIGDKITPEIRPYLRHLLFWAPVPVVFALRFLFPKYGGDEILLQYALRVLEHHPVEVTFFYIPQVVQALRTDDLGYAERFIFETSQISQLFCHQIIWNMKANAYRGDDGEEADPMKPTLDRMIEMISGALDGEAKNFYQREFAFFDEVTSISAKLKPYIKAPKPEKKAKIDEEMAKIKVDPGVYLPSNPDGVVVDINRTSGRPLQSHAKAPFMATFKVRREHKGAAQADIGAQDALLVEGEENNGGDASQNKSKTFDTWQSAIFKVGDDCRQDVLALQIIAMAKNVFISVGLDLLVTPYKVTATGPGCGVIDVIPDSTSRDEMGRAKINDLKSFFLVKYGSTDSIAFQRARNNFIQSMAAYSLLCYLVQIKDRHNGNIMLDGRGCLIHIDFGFLFDIGPGGVKFEPSSFKLTHEMIVLMGGKDSAGFRQFTELTVKSFLACRPYALAIIETSAQMAQAGFPSYKDEHTMDRLQDRFKLELNEPDAAEYMKGVINNALENPRSIVYDEFQRMTNGIPYVR